MKLNRLFILLLLVAINGCGKEEDPVDYFIISVTGGTSYSTEYVSKPIPTEPGTFSMQYNEPADENGDYTVGFWILISNRSDAYLTITSPAAPVIGREYVNNSMVEEYVSFGLYLDNTDVCPLGNCRTTVVFESFACPGKIKGSLIMKDTDGNIIATGDFDFTAV
jgi:hypothetical protein